MARRKNDLKQQSDNAPDKSSARVMRRRRRGPTDGRPRSEVGGAQERMPQNAEKTAAYSSPPPPSASVRFGRAPRPADPPPKNPNVFSYTYTIWKSS